MGKIVLATTVVGPFARPESAAWWPVFIGSVVAAGCFMLAVWVEWEETT